MQTNWNKALQTEETASAKALSSFIWIDNKLTSKRAVPIHTCQQHPGVPISLHCTSVSLIHIFLIFNNFHYFLQELWLDGVKRERMVGGEEMKRRQPPFSASCTVHCAPFFTDVTIQPHINL